MQSRDIHNYNFFYGQPTSFTSNPSSAPSTRSTEARLEHLLSITRDVGFSDFDEAIISYYVAQLDETSPISYQQRQSRNRRLPSVLAALQQNAGDWTTWEKRGYHNEVMISAEDILETELRNFVGSPLFYELLYTVNRSHMANTGPGISNHGQDIEALLALQRNISTEVRRDGSTAKAWPLTSSLSPVAKPMGHPISTRLIPSGRRPAYEHPAGSSL
ncbi:hypothetical protein K461DRAFT_317842 [Myriangium duriaei CBS 260.36]|uniref:Uncharacterized protein n=1 Tax=Myriangium duriaei CBS 260.36 TaxID=1168546 RepID=A0A9P4JAB8_9PEZI|nr:hypothetical protein K461DRAFT_317842 [Myriangium duriaei CBS 260.36]